MLNLRVFLTLGPAFLYCFQASGQSVISVHSGVVHFVEGAVFVDDQPIELKFGKFANIKQGSELRTEAGRAEILLTPDVFLRVGENSAIRMISNFLADTRVEFLHGSVMIESVPAVPKSSVIAVYKGYQLRFAQRGLYRMDSEPPQMEVYSGRAEVFLDGAWTLVEEAHRFSFSTALVTEKTGDTEDSLYRWTRNRSDSISSENMATAQTNGDTALSDIWQSGSLDLSPYLSPLYIPPIGAVPLGTGAAYSPFGLYPFGFSPWNSFSYYSLYGPRLYGPRIYGPRFLAYPRPVYPGSLGYPGRYSGGIRTPGAVTPPQSRGYGHTVGHPGPRR